MATKKTTTTSRKTSVKAPSTSAAPKVARRAATTKPNSQPAMTPEQRRDMIAMTAYYLAERRGFEPGHELTDWLEAEQQIDQQRTA